MSLRKIVRAKNIGQHEHQPIVREVEAEEEVADDDDEARRKIPAYKPPYIKIKIDLVINIGCPKLKFHDRSNGTRAEVIVKKFVDTTEHMRFLTKNRLIVYMNRLYSMKTKVEAIREDMR